MSIFSFQRRRALRLAASAVLMLGLAACGKGELAVQGSDITGTHLGTDMAMTDNTGQPRTLADYHGKVVVVFFGFTQCPDVCPTSMAELAHTMELLGKDAEKVQVLMVSVDPKRDTVPILDSYVKAFNPAFGGLTGTPEQLAATAKSFRAYYSKVPGPTPDEYTMDHGSSFYLIDQDGESRVLLRGDAPAQTIAHDIRQLL